MSEMKNRNYGIDLLRMFSMLLVAILHVLGNGGILEKVTVFSVHYEIAWFLEIAAYCAVNCYALISGYVGVHAKFKYSNIVVLWLQVAFYTILITVFFGIFVPGSVSVKQVIMAVFPVMFYQYWYFTAYFCMFFFIPFFNYILNSMDRKRMKRLIITAILLFSILPTLFHRDVFGTGAGYSALWLSVLYLLGGYIGKYGFLEKLSKIKLLGIYGACIVVTWLSKYCLELLTSRIWGDVFWGDWLVQYTSPTILLSGIVLVLLFSRLNINIGKKAIALCSSLAFSVYLIHVHPLIWEYIIKGRFQYLASASPVLLIVGVLLGAISIYVVCSVVDLLRYVIFKKCQIKEKCAKLEQKILRDKGSFM